MKSTFFGAVLLRSSGLVPLVGWSPLKGTRRPPSTISPSLPLYFHHLDPYPLGCPISKERTALPFQTSSADRTPVGLTSPIWITASGVGSLTHWHFGDATAGKGVRSRRTRSCFMSIITTQSGKQFPCEQGDLLPSSVVRMIPSNRCSK